MSKETSRREFIALSGAALAAATLGAQAPERRLFAYVGRRTRAAAAGGGAARGAAPAGAAGAPAGASAAAGAAAAGGAGRGAAVPSGGGVTVFSVNMSDGSLTKVSETGPEVDDLNCDGICASADGRFVYAVNQTKDLGGVAGVGGGVAAFAINRADGSLRHLNTQPSMGSNPVGVIIDRTNARVLVANHGAVQYIPAIVKRNGVPVVEIRTDEATVSMYPVRSDGSLEAACDVSVFDPRPQSEAARALSAWKAPAAHRVVFDRTGRWAIASDNGFDRLYVYPFSPTSRTLQGKSYPTPPGKAPRHFAVHPRAPYIFFTNEREPSVSSYFFDSSTGEPRHLQTIPTIPDGYSGPNVSPSSIEMHPNGRFLYSQNRGDNSLAMFSIDEASGRLTFLGTLKCGGQGPREMGIEPSGRYLFECNQGSGDITTFAIDAGTGRLTQGPKFEMAQGGVISFAVI